MDSLIVSLILSMSQSSSYRLSDVPFYYFENLHGLFFQMRLFMKETVTVALSPSTWDWLCES